jgi:hypothetical protein
MPPTAARLSAQPAIVKIRRVDAFIAARGALLVLIIFTALERAEKYRDRAVPALRAHVLPPPPAHWPRSNARWPLPPRVRLCRCALAFAAARPPLHSHSFKFLNHQGAPFSPSGA